MKNLTNLLIITLCLIVAYVFFYMVLGADANFTDPKTGVVDFHNPQNAMGMVFTGGPLVGLLIACVLLAITYAVERWLSISKAKGKASMDVFAKEVVKLVEGNKLGDAVKACENQRGSLANVLREAVLRFQHVENDSSMNVEQRLGEVQRIIDENMNLETPLLEKNLVILSTVASISTMIGLLGTTVGMIRAFAALGAGGTVSAQQLSIGISEALYNTAGGLLAAIISIVAYNMFTTMVDNFTYQMDEAILSLNETFSIRLGSKA
ncbi:MAG: MotA/TolQ/ExbB proton channel [Chlorobi bacterium OLB6]|nr:MAG: MotA/TolQ/ExbB proton channel [Chlorobi bacterium OLB6]MBW7853030.1 MotA/TolQ/ExbB proton channel family protein [Candidatus Kapabacteria bacterium]